VYRNEKIKLYKTAVLLVPLYMCKTWPLTLIEDNKSTVFQKRVLKRIFGPKKHEVMGGCKKTS
jgi:hypothetical protein